MATASATKEAKISDSASKKKSKKVLSTAKKNKVFNLLKKSKKDEDGTRSGGNKNYQKPLKSHGKAKKRPSEDTGDDTWEMAVKKARGLPDGASDGSTMSTKSSKPEKIKKSLEKKPFKVFKSAAGKLKKFTNKSSSDDKKGQKRKRSDDDDGEKKLEEMTVKERKKQRKMQKNNFETSQRAKTIWEQLRRSGLKSEKKEALCDELQKLLKGKTKEMVFAHDTSRVVQCLMKFGNLQQRNSIFEELREHTVEMAKSKYAKFFVRKLLKYGTKGQRDYVFRSFYGNVRKLVRHKEAAAIVECAYNEYANALQRSAMIEEFYGPTYALYKTPELKTLEQIVASSNEKRDKILSHMKEVLSVLIDKTICQFSIVHKAFYDYFTHATDKYKADMIEVVRESLIHMVHTRDGAHVTMQCLWNGTAKDRKVIIKSMKTYVLKICKEDYGHLVLLALFDVVDDTKLVQKVILDEMLKNLNEVVQDPYGRKVLLYLLNHRDPLHFNPDVVRLLQTGDNNPHSKKDAAIRREELCEHVSTPLLLYITEHTRELVMNNASLLLMVSILTHCKGDPSSAMKAVCEIAAEPFTSNDLENYHIIEHPAGHLTLKKLVQNDHSRIKDSQPVLFTNILMETLQPGTLKSWAACNRGCFVLITMLELGVDNITKRVKSELSTIMKSLRKLDFKGAQILLEKL